MIKIGCDSYYYIDQKNFAQGMRRMKSHGYDCMDYQNISSPDCEMFHRGMDEFERYFSEFGACAKETGIEVYQMHGLWPRRADGKREISDEDIELYEKQLIAAKLMGCKRLIIHPCMPYGWEADERPNLAFDQTVETIERLLPSAKEKDVIICLENMPFANKAHSFSNIGEVKKVIETFSCANVKVCFDTGHSHVSGEDPYECIKTLGDDLAALHVHDTKYGQDMHMLPLQGVVDWDGFLRGLNEIGYQGCFNLETGISWKTPEPMREKMQIELANIAKWLAAQIGGEKVEKI
ncbi:MAG: sugar phosphate isomerase/epimerase [Clostridia bacterium]|nr:sugar phosphate isomerase/epimerase [Clostridia bacterium]